MVVLAAFQYKDHGKVAKSKVDRMDELSPEYSDHRLEFDLRLPKVLVSLMQNMYQFLPVQCCLSEAEEDFQINIGPLVII
ncbi:hypothetical protein DPMN_022754 [Dreissena polymorpha]|uniref:Uncharacterized protein n=1 Tax=Dreissena polymorpha TaxID=45954 RepID=A0A9D4NN01_DREPO|nr:hypothetical protein DPMN_022754 [Dreissena polymorpha]